MQSATSEANAGVANAIKRSCISKRGQIRKFEEFQGFQASLSLLQEFGALSPQWKQRVKFGLGSLKNEAVWQSAALAPEASKLHVNVDVDSRLKGVKLYSLFGVMIPRFDRRSDLEAFLGPRWLHVHASEDKQLGFVKDSEDELRCAG